MKLSQKVRYGVACLMTLAERYGEFVEAERIAQRQAIPAFAQKVMQALAQAGLVTSLKGVGYRLARPLNMITALQVMEALGGQTESALAGADPLAGFERSVNRALGQVTLADAAGAR